MTITRPPASQIASQPDHIGSTVDRAVVCDIPTVPLARGIVDDRTKCPVGEWQRGYAIPLALRCSSTQRHQVVYPADPSPLLFSNT